MVQEDQSRYVKLLQKNPQQSAPALSLKSLTVEQLHRYKEQLRAFDAARLQLKLATTDQIQRENSAVGSASHAQILQFSQHA
jgi:hypothetical protein